MKQGRDKGNILYKGLCYLYTHEERNGVLRVRGGREGEGICLLSSPLTPLTIALALIVDLGITDELQQMINLKVRSLMCLTGGFG